MTKGEQTRQRIIEEAAPVFNQRGFAGCSMQDVMEATGMEKGGLYRHFASKEELAVAVFRYALGTVVRMRTEQVGQVEGAVEKLRFLINHFVETPSIMPGGCPLLNTAIDADDGNPALRQLALEGFQAWKGRLCRIVEAGIAAGTIRDDVEPRRIANTIVAMLEGALVISRLEGKKTALEDAQVSLEAVLVGMARC